MSDKLRELEEKIDALEKLNIERDIKEQLHLLNIQQVSDAQILLNAFIKVQSYIHNLRHHNEIENKERNKGVAKEMQKKIMTRLENILIEEGIEEAAYIRMRERHKKSNKGGMCNTIETFFRALKE